VIFTRAWKIGVPVLKRTVARGGRGDLIFDKKMWNALKKLKLWN
jgi:hypothetical protein